MNRATRGTPSEVDMFISTRDSYTGDISKDAVKWVY